MSGRSRADVLGAAQDVDVVDHQLDVTGLAPDARDDRHCNPYRDQDCQLEERSMAVRSEDRGQRMEQADIAGTDDPTEDADTDDRDGRAPNRMWTTARDRRLSLLGTAMSYHDIAVPVTPSEVQYQAFDQVRPQPAGGALEGCLRREA